MADPFFDGGKLPVEFNRASGAEQPPKQPENPELNYNPPQPAAPGLGTSYEINDVAREELNDKSREAISEAQQRMERGETELGTPILTPEFNRSGWSSQEIDEVRKEDQSRNLELEPEWDEQTQREYERWSAQSAAERYEERWGDRSESEKQQDQAYEDFIRDQNAEIQSNPEQGVEQSINQDRDSGIEH